MNKKNVIITNEYFDLLEKIKTHITNAQYQVLTTANVEKTSCTGTLEKSFWNTAHGEINL